MILVSKIDVLVAVAAAGIGPCCSDRAGINMEIVTTTNRSVERGEYDGDAA